MILKTPFVFQHSSVKCDVRGFTLRPGDIVKTGDYLAEVRYEVVDDMYSDCPVVQYGDIVAEAEGVVRSVEENLSGPMGLILGEIGDAPGDFPVTFVMF
ncbi:hypothetical protein [uncultured Pseudodesulfovibrio sp.]|uniref:hypothetical protein n=1 Tax=uncultured Pseudodesulfovibrio sp. TaxID=2035858 RepID=UPI0029C84DE2|nr:hypothetical protein [uncultured Pseudodesulfovibrio sp.]